MNQEQKLKAITLIKEALTHSVPTMEHYPEPVKHHNEAKIICDRLHMELSRPSLEGSTMRARKHFEMNLYHKVTYGGDGELHVFNENSSECDGKIQYETFCFTIARFDGETKDEAFKRAIQDIYNSLK
jgi:hypothetical protein